MGRQAERVTLEQLPKLADEMYMDPVYVERVRAMMADDEMVVFAVKDGEKYVGRCSLWLAPADEPEVRKTLPDTPLVNALEVHPDYYRQGIATDLICALEDEALQRGKHQLALGVEPQNTPARKLYEKLGFRYVPLGDSNTYVSRWDEAQPDGTTKHYSVETLLMVKDL